MRIVFLAIVVGFCSVAVASFKHATGLVITGPEWAQIGYIGLNAIAGGIYAKILLHKKQ